MLKVDDVAAITQYCRVQGNSMRQAARVFRRARNTIARVVKSGMEDFRGKDGAHRAPRVLLPEHRSYIDDVLQGRHGEAVRGKQKPTAITITNKLRQENAYQGSVSQVRRYINRRRGELGLDCVGEVPLDRVKAPGGLCETDWTQVQISLAGILTSIWLLVARFRYSGAMFVRGYRAADTESLQEGLQGAFEFFGGVPRVVWMDNQTLAVREVLKGRRREETAAYKAFRAHYGFQGQYSMPASPDENGGCEAMMRPAAQWLALTPGFARMSDLNSYLLEQCRGYMRHQIRDRSGLVGENFQVERNLLIPLPGRRYDTAREVRAKVNRQSYFVYREVGYSVPLAYRRREVIVRGYGEEVVARCQGREIARHPRCFEKGGLVLDPLHFLPVLRRKPHALDHAVAFDAWPLPLIYEHFRAELERRHQDGLRRYVDVLNLLGQFPMPLVTGALRQAAAHRTYSAEAVLFHVRLGERNRGGEPREIPEDSAVPLLKLPVPDVRQYETLAM